MSEPTNPPRSKSKEPRPRVRRYCSYSELHTAPVVILARLDRIRYYIATLAFVTAAVLVLRTPAATNFWQQINLLRDAERLATTGKVTAVHIDLLTEACAEAPDRPSLLRALATAAADTDPALARRSYTRMVELGAATPADIVRGAAVLLKFQDFKGARAWLDKAPMDSVKTMEEYLFVRVALARESADFPAAIEMLDALARQNAADIPECLATAKAAVTHDAAGSIIDRIESMTLAAFERSAAAGRIAEIGCNAASLTELPLQDPANRTRALKVLQCLGTAPVEQRVPVVLFSLETKKAGPEEVRRACLSEIYRDWGVTVLEKVRVASLLQRRHEHALVVEMITLPESLAESALFRHRFESLLQLGKWREAAAMAAASPEALPERKRLLESLAKLHQGIDSPDAPALLREALKQACESRFTPACYGLACAALEQRHDQLAGQGFRTVLAEPSINARMVEAMLASARIAGLDAAATLRMLTGETPPPKLNATVKTRVLYLRLLTDSDVCEAQSDLESLAASGTPDAYIRFLSALNQYHRGEFKEAGNCLGPVAQQRWRDGEAAVIASIMAAAGRFEQSASFMEHVNASGLFPEERAMVAPWVARMTAERNALSLVEEEQVQEEQP